MLRVQRDAETIVIGHQTIADASSKEMKPCSSSRPVTHHVGDTSQIGVPHVADAFGLLFSDMSWRRPHSHDTHHGGMTGLPVEKFLPTGRPDRGIAVELCAGLGGMSLGLRGAGFTVARAYDSWASAIAIYNHNFGNETGVLCDLLSGIGRRMFTRDCKKLGEIELLAAGPPCKGFSQLKNGRHDGRSKTNRVHNRVLSAIPEYVAIARPRMVLIENVPALEVHRNGETLREFLCRLAAPHRRLHYEVSHQIYDAAHFGVPQSRRRLLVLAVRRGDGKETLPRPSADLRALFAAIRHEKKLPPASAAFAASLKDPADLRLTSSLQALSDLPDLPAGVMEDSQLYERNAYTAYQQWARRGAGTHVDGTRTPGVTSDTLARLAHVRPGGCARDIPERHLNGLVRRYDSAYRRLHPDAPSTALSTKYDCVYHYGHPRSLSLREYSRLQGLPDLIGFPEKLVTRRNAYELIGNSVPPRLVQGVFEQIFECVVSSREPINDERAVG